MNCMSREYATLISLMKTGSFSINSLPFLVCSSNIAEICSISTDPSGRLMVWTKSCLRSATKQPSAFVIPGRVGIKTSGIPSSRARAEACIGPAPPNANKEKSRGSLPRDKETIRVAPAIRVVAICITAAAAVSASTFSGSPSCSWNISRTLAGSTPPGTASNLVGSNRPSIKLASEIVGLKPPSP